MRFAVLAFTLLLSGVLPALSEETVVSSGSDELMGSPWADWAKDCARKYEDYFAYRGHIEYEGSAGSGGVPLSGALTLTRSGLMDFEPSGQAARVLPESVSYFQGIYHVRWNRNTPPISLAERQFPLMMQGSLPDAGLGLIASVRRMLVDPQEFQRREVLVSRAYRRAWLIDGKPENAGVIEMDTKTSGLLRFILRGEDLLPLRVERLDVQGNPAAILHFGQVELRKVTPQKGKLDVQPPPHSDEQRPVLRRGCTH